MNKHFDPAISEEKFAAWLDGMLPQDEMMQVSSIIDNDCNFQSILGASDAIDACIADDSLGISDCIESQDFSIRQDMMELPALESLPLSTIDIDFSNGIFPSFLPDHFFSEDTSQLDLNDMSSSFSPDDSTNNM